MKLLWRKDTSLSPLSKVLTVAVFFFRLIYFAILIFSTAYLLIALVYAYFDQDSFTSHLTPSMIAIILAILCMWALPPAYHVIRRRERFKRMVMATLSMFLVSLILGFWGHAQTSINDFLWLFDAGLIHCDGHLFIDAEYPTIVIC